MSTPDLPFSPAADRNRGPILEALTRIVPIDARVLEIASGTGQHAQHFAAMNPRWRWQPSDTDPAMLPAIAARCATLPNVDTPVLIDVLAWPPSASLGVFDAAYCANMVHIAPWRCCAALMRGWAAHLAPGAPAVLYGPFIVDGEPTAPSNLAFDADLRARNAEWGLRRLEDVIVAARDAGLAFEQRLAMPANNALLVFRAKLPA